MNMCRTKTYLDPKRVLFSLLNRDDIVKLCVTKITTPLTLDKLGHPLSGGLYDPTLGPLSEKSGPCSTCGRNLMTCPGHLGYIELPLVVINPMFHKLIGRILQMSCLHCYAIQLPPHFKYLLIMQNKLLNTGLVAEALEVETRIMELIGKYGAFEKVPVTEVSTLRSYEALTNTALQQTEESCYYSILSKNTEFLRTQFIDNIMRMARTGKKCIYCKQPCDRIQVAHKRIILTSPQQKGAIFGAVKAAESKFLTPVEARDYMRQIWQQDAEFVQELCPVLQYNAQTQTYPTDALFMDVVVVVPPNVRPLNIVGDRYGEHAQTVAYKKIVQDTILLRLLVQVVKNDGDLNAIPIEAKAAYSYAYGNTPIDKLNNAWETLQNNVNALVDRDPALNRDGIGLKQIIEKKSGLIRKRMMGKRVNYSARTVITPDPNISVNEIGVPEVFARHLSYPVAVTPWNVHILRDLILNGPDQHPGALMIENEDGTVVRLSARNRTQRESLLKCLLTPDEKGFKGVKRVHRHLINGDILLVNRQPTLHRPSIMAHCARILKGEKTLRLHYANCKAYNADFDGDEMNAHCPQNEVGRSEAYNLVNVKHHYLVPKDGTPLSGLIQDHIISGVQLSIRGRFFTKTDYQLLVYQALETRDGVIRLLPPAIQKPRPLWSGKQILSTVIINLLPQSVDGRCSLNLIGRSKIDERTWQIKPIVPHMSEFDVVIRNGELLVGVLDKNHYGPTPYGLVHCIYELYGGQCTIQMLSSLTKLFTRFMQMIGFTLGVRDILTVPEADLKRRRQIKRLRRIGTNVMRSALDLPLTATPNDIQSKLIQTTSSNPKLRMLIDRQYKQTLDPYTNRINQVCIPSGLREKFPTNNLQLMVQSGAKGSTVNTMQISCLLGQIELEGRRPPTMINGRSLPSFPLFEFAPRAGGYIDGRFMTGIQPQEFFFHCMAGREGLIDTAVKTSRSGYLQRCLIKHLEGLTVGYDMTVRDSDQSVIQFLYGEDGFDVAKAQFLNTPKQLQFLLDNKAVLMRKRAIIKRLKRDDCDVTNAIKQHRKSLRIRTNCSAETAAIGRNSAFSEFATAATPKLQTKYPDANDVDLQRHLLTTWHKLPQEARTHYEQKCRTQFHPTAQLDPLNAIYQADANFGVISERLDDLLHTVTDDRRLRDLIYLKAMESYCAPGEPVGLLAAQSIGEPSTQMTLNTFHFAGRGDMNVTLGIPRLREILMLASRNLKTPSMEIPFKRSIVDLEEQSTRLRKILKRVVVADVLQKIDVDVDLVTEPVREYRYRLRFQFLPKLLYKNDYHVRPKTILKHMQKRFFNEMFMTLRRHAKIHSNLVTIDDNNNPRNNNRTNDENDDDDEEEGEGATVVNGDIDSSDNDDDNDELGDLEDAKMTAKHANLRESGDPDDEENDALLTDDDDNNDNTVTMTEETSIQSDDQDVQAVLSAFSMAKNYTYDTKRHRWCELTFGLALTYNRIDLTTLLRDVAQKSVIWETPNIRRAIIYEKNDDLVIRTDGINMLEMFKYHQILDLNRLHCNDIHMMANTYGIEAATKVIVKEVQDVFNVYGIKVDVRHLSLIADYMTFSGLFAPLSRKGMEGNASPLQQMSFESSLTFVRAATIGGKQDNLVNPSSCLMVGKPCRSGTGSFDLLSRLHALNSY